MGPRKVLEGEGVWRFDAQLKLQWEELGEHNSTPPLSPEGFISAGPSETGLGESFRSPPPLLPSPPFPPPPLPHHPLDSQGPCLPSPGLIKEPGTRCVCVHTHALCVGVGGDCMKHKGGAMGPTATQSSKGISGGFRDWQARGLRVT